MTSGQATYPARYRQPQVRQNPDGRRQSPPGPRPELCPIHGSYIPVRAWLDLRNRAVSGQEPEPVAARMLETAARLRARCRECNQQCLTGPQWAERVRLRIEAQEGVPEQ